MGNTFAIKPEYEEEHYAFIENPSAGQPSHVENYVTSRNQWITNKLQELGMDLNTNPKWREVLTYSKKTNIPPIDLIIHGQRENHGPKITETLGNFLALLQHNGLTVEDPEMEGGAAVVPYAPASEESKEGYLESINEIRATHDLPPMDEEKSQEVLLALMVMRKGFSILEGIKGSPIEEE